MKKINRKGFTLIELIVVIILLVLLMSVAGVSVNQILEKNRKKTTIASLSAFIDSAKIAITGDETDRPFMFPNKDTGTDIFSTNEAHLFFIPRKCLDLDKGDKSGWSGWDEKLTGVLLHYTGEGNPVYGIQFKDKTGHKLTPITESDLSKAGQTANKISTSASVQVSDPSSENIQFDGKTFTPKNIIVAKHLDGTECK